MNKDKINDIMDTFTSELVAAMNRAEAALVAAFPDPVVVVPPTPEPVPPTPIPSPTQKIRLQNMDFNAATGIYRSYSNLSSLNKCYLQILVDTAPRNYVKLSVERRTNVRLDGTKNIKTARLWPEDGTTYPNIYVARGLKEGAEKVTIELVGGGFLNIAWPSIPYMPDVWVKEIYEFDFVAKTMKCSWGSYVKTATNVAYPPAVYRTFGVQCVYAPNTGDSGGLPSGSYVEFRNPMLEWR